MLLRSRPHAGPVRPVVGEELRIRRCELRDRVVRQPRQRVAAVDTHDVPVHLVGDDECAPRAALGMFAIEGGTRDAARGTFELQATEPPEDVQGALQGRLGSPSARGWEPARRSCFTFFIESRRIAATTAAPLMTSDTTMSAPQAIALLHVYSARFGDSGGVALRRAQNGCPHVVAQVLAPRGAKRAPIGLGHQKPVACDAIRDGCL
jgi:hypothetical protein